MVNVEADALAGRSSRAAREHNVVYSLAYGDQPALICEMVDWCRAAGFEVVAAGKGTKYLPSITGRRPTRCGRTTDSRPRRWRRATSTRECSTRFLDGTKSAIEMAAVANATGLTPSPTASRFRRAASTTCRASSARRQKADACTMRSGRGDLEPRTRRASVFRDLRWGVT
jgi:predicted homoserine dehydrogenase-like protein